jgi:hypothetical protein
MTETLPITSSSGLPALAPSPLINGEDAAAYQDLETRIRTVLQPRDVFEELWARDVADLAWEVLRLRRLKAHLMRACAHEGMLEMLDPLLPVPEFDSDGAADAPDSDDLAQQWFVGDAEAATTVDKTLAAAGLSMDAVMARTLAARIEDVERIERMMTAAEARRDSILRELERRRAGAAARLRRAMAEAEDAEFEVVAPAIASAGP